MIRTPEALSRRERQIMDILFQRSEATVAEVMADIPDAPSYNSVRNLMSLLEKKGHLEHREDGIRYLYRPTQPRSSAAQRALRRVVETFFGGSVEQTVTALLSSEELQISDEGAARINNLIAEVRAEEEKAKEGSIDDGTA